VADEVLVAYLHPNAVSHSFSDSLMRLVAWDLAHRQRVIATGGPLMFRCGPGGLVEARNDVVKHFLDETTHDWLWVVDSDMGFAPDTVDRLLDAADPVARPVMGGLCFALRETAPDGLGGWRTHPVPTLYDWARKPDGEHGFASRRDYRVNTVTQVAGTGSACLLIHRNAVTAVRERDGDTWYDRVSYASGTRVSEDLSFCYRLGLAGVPVWVHTGVRTTHHKEIWLAETDYWRAYPVPPATDEVAVLVPAMRPANAARFMTTLRASTGLATAYAVVHEDDADTARAWKEAGAQVLTGPAESFAQKCNAGCRETAQPWVFLAGDDVAFHPGWLDHAQHTARTQGAAVVGTNDLGNPRVTSGSHATHLLIARSYLDEQGGSWDGPGIACHEGYRHWYVDNEIVSVAQQRGVWAMALGSVVEHLHPSWGKAATDDVYKLGQSHAEADRKTFEKRCRIYL
jgi:hypothetical protein